MTPEPSESRVDLGELRGPLVSPYAVLAILSLINFFNYVDRFVMAGLAPLLMAPRASGGMALTETEVGLLATAFMLVHSVASVPLGIAADRYMRRPVIAIGVGVWSVATAAAGFARSFGQLFASRAAVGIGEATYAPAASALISERFPERTRARAMGVFQSGMVLGGGAGIVAGTVVGGQWGWRAAFFVVGVPGLLLTVATLLIAEHRRPAPSEAAERARPRITEELRTVFRSPGVGWIYLAGILITFAVGAISNWGPAFVLRYHYGDDRAMLGKVGLTFGPIAVLAAAAGVITGSWLADRIERRRPGNGRMTVVGMGPLLGAPFVALGLITHSTPIFYGCLAFGTFFNSFYGGPVLAALHAAVPRAVRGAATGAYFCVVHLLGDGLSPTVVGAVARGSGSLRIGLGLAALASALGAAAALRAVRGGPREAPAAGSANGDGEVAVEPAPGP